MSTERRRLTLTFLLSVVLHALLLSLTFGSERLGLPGFGFPWRERRIEVPVLRVVLMPVPVNVAEPLQQAAIEQTVGSELSLSPPVTTLPLPSRTAEPNVFKAVVEAKTTVPAKAEPVVAPSEVQAKAPWRAEAPVEVAPTLIPAPEVIAVQRSNTPTFAVPPPPPVPTPVMEAASSVPNTPSPEAVIPAPQSEAVQKAAEPEVRERAVAVTKPDPSEREAQAKRQADPLEAARVEAARREATREEAARVEAAKLEAARMESERREAARQAAAKQEAQRQEAARQEVARAEATRLEAAREAARETARETARREAERQEAVRQAAAQKEAARIQEEKQEDAKRDARRQAMGRILNEEAARREAAEKAARAQSTLPLSIGTARRARLWGRADPNGELVEYAEAWARKIQFNTPVDTVRELAKRPHTNPMVTVAIRRDGSVESVTFVLSSGVAEVDEAIRRIVQSLVPYQAFTPGMAQEYDVIEVRRTWHFDVGVRMN